MSKQLRLGLIASVALWAGSSAGTWADDQAYLDGLYAAAQAAGETELTVFNPNTNSNQPIFDAFQARFPGIAIAGVDLFGPPMIARIESEFAAGGPQVDVIYGMPTDPPILAASGRLEAFTPETAEGLGEIHVGEGGFWHDWTMTIGAPYYNSARVSADEAPTSYADLVDPKWQGNVSMTSLRQVSGTGQALTALMRDGAVDEEWFKALAAQNAVMADANAAAIQNVASGQADIGLDAPYHFIKAAVARGAPFAFVWPKEGPISIPLNAALLKDAPNSEAAKLLIAWFFSDEAQALVAEIGMQGAMPDAPTVAGAPEGDLHLHVIDWRTIADDYPGQLEMYQRVFSQ